MRAGAIFSVLILTIMSAGAQTYEALADSADNYIKRERWQDAERVLLQALRMRPAAFENHLLLSNLGVVQTNLKRPADALRSFGAGLSLAPRSTVLLINRARTYISINAVDSALADLTRSLEVDSTLLWPRKMRGLLHLEKKNIDDALRDFKILFDADPRSGDAMFGIGACRYNKGDYRGAVEMFSKASEHGFDEEALMWEAAAYINMDDFQGASEKIRQGIEKNPQNGDLYLLRAYLHKLQYRTEDAELDIKNASHYGADPQLIRSLFTKKAK